ncbi:MAG: ATP-binding cassette domain-containing protein, partial [Gemmatimonadota bacterium]|nr:ATP-binding cassette domain-containing protein [Gemmatimonadota bacterium]
MTRSPADSPPLVECRDLTLLFKSASSAGRRRQGGMSEAFRAVDRVSLEIFPGETLALVGESGCGKTTTGKLLLRLAWPTYGAVFFEGRDLSRVKGSALRSLRSSMQMIFQDPYGSLNPRFTVGRTLAEPLRIHEKLSGRLLELRLA